uniref:Uncharacterized protein n=1 Tax=Cacopsylla melanoneura TaxID=428564 RepID=A0A8D8R634_9HEMI
MRILPTTVCFLLGHLPHSLRKWKMPKQRSAPPLCWSVKSWCLLGPEVSTGTTRKVLWKPVTNTTSWLTDWEDTPLRSTILKLLMMESGSVWPPALQESNSSRQHTYMSKCPKTTENLASWKA